MSEPQHYRNRTVSGLRTRFFPKNRIGQGLMSVAPWFDILLLLGLFVLIDSKFVLQPGVVVDLPRGPFIAGARPGLVAVIMSVGGQAGPGEEIVFFDDERFLAGQDAQMKALEKAFAENIRRHPSAWLTIQADKSVSHGTIMRMLRMAQDVGVAEINVASREAGE